jgi:hypothetical protein
MAYPPQQPQYPQPPPHQSPPSPRRIHTARNVVLICVGAFLVLIVIGAVAAAVGHNKKPAAARVAASPAAATKSTAPAAPQLTAGEQQFVDDMHSQYNLSSQVTATLLASLGSNVCAYRSTGESQASVVSFVGSQLTTGAAQVAALAEKDMCPRYLPPPPKPRVIARFDGSGIENTPSFNTGSDWHLSWEYWGCDGGSGNFIVTEENTDGSSDFNGVSVNELGSGRGPVATYAYDDAGQHYFSVDSECSWSLAVVSAG